MKTFSAFTLIELLISMTIIALMAVLSISSYPRFSEQITLTGETYKMLAYMRETQAYGISAVSTPGTKFVYSFMIDKSNGTMRRLQIESPTLKTNTYYINTSTLDAAALIYTIRPIFEISDIEGVKQNATTSLDKGYAFFKRPNPEARLNGNVGISISPDVDIGSFERIVITLRSKKNTSFQKKVVILSTGQMYVSDW